MSRYLISVIISLALGAVAWTGCGNETAGKCAVDQEYCGGECVYTSSDHDHCGACDQACMPGQYCASGECLPCQNDCMLGQTQCVPGNPSQTQSCVADSDTCMGWGVPENCPGGQVCSEGQCVTACEDECSRNLSQVCDPDGANGYRVCGYHDADDCLEWGAVVDCTGGTVCDGGQCGGGCENECNTAGALQCSTSANGFDSCADHDTDGCLEWGGFTACIDPETCSNGVCSDPSQCQDDCSPGERECDGNSYRTCGNFDADSCLDWSTYTNCDPGDVCNPATGSCEAACGNQCSAGTLRCAVDQSAVESCADRDSDGCTEWGTAIPCGGGTHCENSACVSSCTPDCTQQGERVCTTFNGDPGYETCGEHDADPCLEYGNFIACPAGQTCSNGVCSATCSPECSSMERQCQGNSVQLCGEANDGDTCLDWLPPVACEGWQQCLDGVCQDDCNTHNECSTAGAKVCTADNSGWQECVSDYDTDPCLEYGAVTNCQTNYTCENGACVLGCENECTTLNAVQCAGAGAGTETCQDHDSDGCLEWGGYDACPNGETCSLGVCASTCTDECDFEFQHVCDGLGAYRVCANNDADSCWDLGDAIPCGYGEECQAATGDCAVVCTDECDTTGALRCSADNAAVESCATDYDGDECREWGVLQACGAGNACYQNACISDDPPFTVIISELLYDDEGVDGEYEFVELWGPAGSSLSGFSLVGVNGANGDEYLTIDLSGATLSSDALGHLLIAQETSLIEGADVTWASPDLQNGADDALQVRWRGEVIVDAVAYEPGSGGSYGEGTKAPSADFSSNMYCLGRQWDNNNGTYRDSNDNFTDFWKRSYCTPGWEGWMYRYGVYNTYSTCDSTPAVDTATGALYVTSDLYIDAVGSDFVGLWFAGKDGAKSSPALSPDGTQVYFGLVAGVDGGLYAYDTSPFLTVDPDPLWIALEGTDIRSSPAVDSAGNLYVGTRYPSFAAVDSSGWVLWEQSETNWVDSSPALAPVGPGGTMIVVYGVGGVGSGDVVARNPSTGAEVWRTSTAVDGASPGGGCNSSPAIGSDGTVYVACDDGLLYALDGTDGSEHWSVEVSNDLGGSTELVKGRSPVVVPGTGMDWIFMTGAGDNLNMTVIDGLTGLAEEAWNYGEALSSITIMADGGYALVWGDGNQHVLDIWGTEDLNWYDELGVYDPDAWILGSVNAEYVSAYGMGFLYLATAEGMLYGYYLPTGLFSSAGSFPKFRADEANQGQRW